MATYKCAYCGKTGNSSTPPRESCISGRSSHSWRAMSDSRICAWRCRKCGKTTKDDQTPMSKEGSACSGMGGTHTWNRI